MLNNLLPQTEHDHANLNSDSPVVSLQTNPTVSYGTNVRVTDLTQVAFSTIVERIRSDEQLKAKVNYVRSFANDAERSNAKASTLPYFSMCRFADSRRENAKFLSTQHLLFDLDHLSDISTTRMQLISDNNVYCVFTSPSGDGLKVIYRLDHEITDEPTYRAVYIAQAERIESKFGHKPDNCDDPARSCFLSYDPDIYVNDSARPISTAVAPKKNQKAPGGQFEGQAPGNRTPTLASLVGKCKKAGIPADLTLALSKSWNTKNTEPLPDEKVEYTVTDLYERYPQTFTLESIDYTVDVSELFQELKAAKAEYATYGTVLFQWLKTNRNAQYFTDENSAHYVYLDERLIPISEESSDFGALLLTTGNLSTATQIGRVVVQVMNASAHLYGKRIQKNTWLQTDRKNLTIHVNLKNDRRELLKITPDSCEIVHNGSNADNVFMLDAPQDKIQPVQFVGLDEAQLKDALQSAEKLVVNHIPASGHDRWLSFGWLMTYPLYDLTNDHFILRYQGRPEMGKSTATRLHSYWVYGTDCLSIQPTVASMHSDASINPLVLDDNLESRTFYGDPGRQTFYLGAGTGGSKQKRELGTNSGLVTEKIRALVLCNGIESIAKSELTSRMMIVECDRELHNSNYTSSVLLDIERNRDTFASANFILTQRVLNRVQSGDWREVQGRLQREYARHPKNRMFEHLSIIVLYLEEFFKAAAMTADVWELLKLWMEDQRNLATDEIINGDPIIQGLDLLMTSARKQHDIESTVIPTDVQEQIIQNRQIKLDVKSLLGDVRVTAESIGMRACAGELLSAISTAYNVYYNQTFPIANSRVLINRLDSVKNELAAHGYEIVEQMNRSKKQKEYKITYTHEQN